MVWGPALHLLTVGTILAIGVVLGVVGRRLAPRAGRRVERGLGLLGLAAAAAAYAWSVSVGGSGPGAWLRLHPCNLLAALAPLALLTHARWAARLVYFAGLSMTPQALFTPLVRVGPENPHFWEFWVLHGQVIWSAAWLLAVRRFRPTWRDWRLACIVGLGYGAVIFGLNLLLDTNFAYLNDVLPGQPTLLDHLGPWPYRVVVMMLIGLAVFTLLMLPFVRRVRRPIRSAGPMD